MKRHVRIGPIFYSVTEIPRLVSDGDKEKILGTAKYASCEIELEATANPQQINQTLFHEVLHIIAYQAGVDSDLDHATLDALAHGLMQVLLDNRWVITQLWGAHDVVAEISRHDKPCEGRT